MLAQQLNIDTIAHNLANVNTTGFKKSRAEFQDLMYQTLKAGGGAVNNALRETNEIQVGTGTVPTATQRVSRKEICKTRAIHLTFRLWEMDSFKSGGRMAHLRTRATDPSSFPRRNDRDIAWLCVRTRHIDHERFKKHLHRSRGIIEVSEGTSDSVSRIGQLELAKFVNVAGLKAIGDNLFVETPSSARQLSALAAAKDSEKFNRLPRIFQRRRCGRDGQHDRRPTRIRINSKTIKTVEDMLQMANNLKRA